MQRVTERHAEIHRLREATWTISAIARRFGLDRKTVRRYLTTDLDVLIASARDRRPHQLDSYRPYLQQRFAHGCTNATQLYREIHEHGYRGNHQAVRLYIRSLRGGTAAAEPPRPIPTPRRITSWTMRPRDGLSREEQDQLDEVRIACPDIATACDLARVFTGLVRDRRGHLLGDWVREAETNGPGPVRGFAGFLRQDWDALLAGLTLDYSSGVVEGHVNRLRRSSGRCTAEAPSGSSAPASCCDRDRHEIPTRPDFRDPHHRHQTLVNCAFSFCWDQWFALPDSWMTPRRNPDSTTGQREGPATPHQPQQPCWPRALHAIRSWLTPAITLNRWWRAWTDTDPPPDLQALIDAVTTGHGIDLIPT
ncbi:hypothetical protein ACFV8Z_38310 [Streptomyces sp. NPDC059837]|uniref:hypothetical protein n=1 Tax=Streptomyces sp. NPDC059837 TaxID=3346968 RepID=UPI003653F9B9